MTRLFSTLALMLLSATSIFADSVTLTWTASTDNVGVVGYRIYRDSQLIGSTANTTYQDTGLAHDQTFTYTVRAYDAAGNESAQATPIQVTTDYAGTCDQTVSVGANLPSLVNSAANNTVICLNNGSYGQHNFWNMSRTGYVTLRSVNSKQASLTNISVGVGNWIIFQDLTINGAVANNCSHHLQFLNNAFVSSGLGITNQSYSCGSNPAVVTIDGNTFTDLPQAGNGDGRLSIIDMGNNSQITVSNNLFNGIGGGSACSDGLYIGGSTGNITVGPNNIFRDLPQSSCGPHVDSIQQFGDGPDVTITRNYFYNAQVFLGFYDGGNNVTVTENVFDTPAVYSYHALQMGHQNNLMIQHNTFKGVLAAFGTKTGQSASTGVIIQNNVLDNSPAGVTALSDTGDQGCTTGCTVRYNLLSRSSTVWQGTNNVTGNASYVGSGSVSNWAGWQLATGSPGENAGNDGLDMGTLYYGP